MKRPISLLCLADIHYDSNGDMSVVDSLYSEFVKYIDEDKSRMKWLPDFIVIAGDVADKNGGYENVKEFIEILRSEKAFNIKSDHIIIVPGNHDKNTKTSIDQNKKNKDVFIQYCKKCIDENIKAFGDAFDPRFREYIDFCTSYTSDLQFNVNGKNCILDERLRCLSGVRVFEDDHICFLYVNTEWLYVPGRENACVIVGENKHVEDISKLVRLDEDCHLCAPLVKDACIFIKNNYSTYTIVTVMHRGFDHFSWEEKNPTDVASIDAIGYLLKTSDIIISGHDHVFSPAPPTLIRNHVQHFQLGAVGRKEPLAMEFQRSAEIIRLDVSNEKVEQLFIDYKNTDTGFRWCFKESRKAYPLYSKFLSKNELTSELPYYHDTIIRAKSSSAKDIERAIHTYFDLPLSNLKPLSAESDIKHKIESLISKNKGNFLYVVVYYHYLEYIEGVKSQNSPIASIKQQIDQFKNEHIKELMSYQIIINEVIVEYPLEED